MRDNEKTAMINVIFSPIILGEHWLSVILHGYRQMTDNGLEVSQSSTSEADSTDSTSIQVCRH